MIDTSKMGKNKRRRFDTESKYHSAHVNTALGLTSAALEKKSVQTLPLPKCRADVKAATSEPNVKGESFAR